MVMPANLAHAQSGGDGLLFASGSGGLLWPSSFHKVWRTARRKAGVPGLRFHDLRHHAAVRAAQEGESFAAVQARLGHSSARAAIRYQHAAANSDRRIAEALDRMRATAIQADAGVSPALVTASP